MKIYMKIYMKIFYSSIFFHSVATGFGTYMWKVKTVQCSWCDPMWPTQWHQRNDAHNDTQWHKHQHTQTYTRTYTWQTTHTYTYNDTHLHTNYHTNLLTHTIINTHSISLRMFYYVSLCEKLLVYIISFVLVLFVLLRAWSHIRNSLSQFILNDDFCKFYSLNFQIYK